MLVASGSVAHTYGYGGPTDKNYHGPEGKPPKHDEHEWGKTPSKWVDDNSKWTSGTGDSRKYLRKPYSEACNVAALVAKIGDSNVRCVGVKISGEIKKAGELKFAINSSLNKNNLGSFKISVQGGHLCGSAKNAW